MPKITFIIYFFLEILHFKQPCNFIGWQHLDPQLETKSFARYGVGVEISVKILVFTLYYFQEKLMTKFIKKYKKLYVGAMCSFSPFLPKFRQKWIFLEKRLCQLLNIQIIYHRAKNQKKLICHSWRKCWTDGWMGRQTEGQTDNHDFVEPSVGRGPIIKVTLSFPEFTSQTSLFY